MHGTRSAINCVQPLAVDGHVGHQKVSTIHPETVRGCCSRGCCRLLISGRCHSVRRVVAPRVLLRAVNMSEELWTLKRLKGGHMAKLDGLSRKKSAKVAMKETGNR